MVLKVYVMSWWLNGGSGGSHMHSYNPATQPPKHISEVIKKAIIANITLRASRWRCSNARR